MEDILEDPEMGLAYFACGWNVSNLADGGLVHWKVVTNP